jgi:hypothetical protein
MDTLTKRPRYDGRLILEDAAKIGLNSYRLSQVIGVQPSTLARFIDGLTRSVTLAQRVADALEQPVSRYVLSAETARPPVPPALAKGRYSRQKKAGA